MAQQLPNKTTLSIYDFGLNPALTALDNTFDFGLYHQQKWLNFKNAPSTSVASFQLPLTNHNMGIGGYLLHEEINILESNEIALTYRYKMRVGLSDKDQLSLGFLVHAKQIRFKGEKIISSSLDDPLLFRENLTSIDGNFNFGIFYTSNRFMQDNDDNSFFVGFSAAQIIPTENGVFDNIKYKKRIHANGLIGAKIVKGFIFWEPSISLNFTPNAPIHAQAAIRMEKQNTFWFGLHYILDNTAGLQVGVIKKIKTGFLRIGGLGGLNIGTTGQERGVTYEVLIGYQFEM